MQLLDSGWTLATDPLNQGREQGWFGRERAEAVATPVPGVIQQLFPDYHGVAWYWLRFRPAQPPAPNEHTYLRFAAVDYLAEVWVNGVKAGSHEGADTPFTLDVTGMVKADGDNLLAVRVLNPTDEAIDGIILGETPHRNKFIRNYQPGRGYNYGGINAPVELLVLPAVHIVDLFARSDSKTGQIRVTVTVQNEQPQAASGALTLAVGPANAGDLLDQAAVEATFPPGSSVQELSLTVEQPRLWDLHDPYLYRILAALPVLCGTPASCWPSPPPEQRPPRHVL